MSGPNDAGESSYSNPTTYYSGILSWTIYDNMFGYGDIYRYDDPPGVNSIEGGRERIWEQERDQEREQEGEQKREQNNRHRHQEEKRLLRRLRKQLRLLKDVITRDVLLTKNPHSLLLAALLCALFLDLLGWFIFMGLFTTVFVYLLLIIHPSFVPARSTGIDGAIFLY